MHPSHSFGRGSLRSRARWTGTPPLLTVVEMVLADISHHAEAEMVAGMIEDQKMILALGRAKAPTDRLNEQNPALGRTRENDAAHVQIDPGRQHTDIADDSRLARAKAIENCLPVFSGGRAVHVFRRDSRFDETFGYMLSVATIDAEAERRAVLSTFKPSLDNVPGDDGSIHRLRQLAFVEVACDGPRAARSGSLGANIANGDR